MGIINLPKLVLRKAGTEISKPEIITEYNKYMNGVDCYDQYLASYTFSLNTVKWWNNFRKKSLLRILTSEIISYFLQGWNNLCIVLLLKIVVIMIVFTFTLKEHSKEKTMESRIPGDGHCLINAILTSMQQINHPVIPSTNGLTEMIRYEILSNSYF